MTVCSREQLSLDNDSLIWFIDKEKCFIYNIPPFVRVIYLYVVGNIYGKNVSVFWTVSRANDGRGQCRFPFRITIFQSNPILCRAFNRSKRVVSLQRCTRTYRTSFLRGQQSHHVLEFTITEHAHIHVLHDEDLRDDR